MNKLKLVKHDEVNCKMNLGDIFLEKMSQKE